MKHSAMNTTGKSRRLLALAVVAGLLSAGAFATVDAQDSGSMLKALFGGEKEKAVSADTIKAPTLQAGFADLVEKVMPAVVSIEVEIEPGALRQGRHLFRKFGGELDKIPPELRKFFKDFLDQFGGLKRFGIPDQPLPRYRGRSVGSGFFISSDGYVVTNHHVVGKATKIWVKTADGKRYRARLLGSDKKTDLALLKVDAKDRSFHYVQFADKEPRVGEWVIAVGNPFGFGGTVTAGIVSAKGRYIGTGPYDDFLQIDAAINRGNSGGPTFNMQGRVVGVNTAIFSPTGGSVGIGFAIPARVVQKVVRQLKERGHVVRGWLGVQIQAVDEEMAEGLGLSEPHGAIIVKVTPDSPAERAGLKTGDVILEVNGRKVKNPRHLAMMVADIEPGTLAKVTILRDGRRQTLDVKIGRMPSDDAIARVFGKTTPSAVSPADLGLSLRPAEDGEGVIIAEVDPDSRAAEKGLRPGDRILEVAGEKVKAPADFGKAIATARKKGRKAVLLLVRTRNGDQRFIALPLKKK